MINVHVIYLRRLAEAATTDLETQNLSDAADALAKRDATIKRLKAEVERLQAEVAAAQAWDDEMRTIGAGVSLGPAMDGYRVARKAAAEAEREGE